jgi:hypothetical protein
MSPVDVSVPITTKSSEMIEGAERPVRFGGCCMGRLPGG